jgi:hypothetical protein
LRMELDKKFKVLCLHGFRTSGSFLKKQISKWNPSIFQQFDMVFPDGIFPAGGKSEIEGIFPPPYFEWFQFNKDFTEYTNLDECISYLCDYMVKNGPFDGLLGFSQVKMEPSYETYLTHLVLECYYYVHARDLGPRICI